MGSLNFDPAYQNEEEPVVLEKDNHGLYQYCIIDDIFTKPSETYGKVSILRTTVNCDPVYLGSDFPAQHICTHYVYLEEVVNVQYSTR